MSFDYNGPVAPPSVSPYSGQFGQFATGLRLSPYGEPYPQRDEHTGENAPPYDAYIPSYGSPGPIGRRVFAALEASVPYSERNGALKIGLPGMGDRAVYYDIFSPQLYLRLSPQQVTRTVGQPPPPNVSYKADLGVGQLGVGYAPAGM